MIWCDSKCYLVPRRKTSTCWFLDQAAPSYRTQDVPARAQATVQSCTVLNRVQIGIKLSPRHFLLRGKGAFFLLSLWSLSLNITPQARYATPIQVLLLSVVTIGKVCLGHVQPRTPSRTPSRRRGHMHSVKSANGLISFLAPSWS